MNNFGNKEIVLYSAPYQHSLITERDLICPTVRYHFLIYVNLTEGIYQSNGGLLVVRLSSASKIQSYLVSFTSRYQEIENEASFFTTTKY